MFVVSLTVWLQETLAISADKNSACLADLDLGRALRSGVIVTLKCNFPQANASYSPTFCGSELNSS